MTRYPLLTAFLLRLLPLLFMPALGFGANTLFVFGSSSTSCKPLSTYVDGAGSWTSTQACLPGSTAATENPVQSVVYSGKVIVVTQGTSTASVYTLTVGNDPSVSTNWTQGVAGQSNTQAARANIACSSTFCLFVTEAGDWHSTDGVTWGQDGGRLYYEWSTSTNLMGSNNDIFNVYLTNSLNQYASQGNPYPAGTTGNNMVFASDSTNAAYASASNVYYISSNGYSTYSQATGCSITSPVGVMNSNVGSGTSLYFFGKTAYCTAAGAATSFTQTNFSQSLVGNPTAACMAGTSSFILVNGGGVYGLSSSGTLAGASGPTSATACAATGQMAGTLPSVAPPATTTRVIIIRYRTS